MCQALCKEKHIASFPGSSWETEQECEIHRSSEELGECGLMQAGTCQGRWPSKGGSLT